MTDASGAARPTLWAADLHARVRETAFALLMTTGRPISAREVSAIADVPADGIEPLLDELAAVGWIDRDADGRVTGAGGLSLTDGPHHLAIGGRAFRNWCAYDSLGIAAALEADATIRTSCPVCSRPVTIETPRGEPARDHPERLWLAEGGTDLRADFCTPTVILCSTEHGEVWAGHQGGRGRLVDLTEGAALGRKEWASCAEAAARVAAG